MNEKLGYALRALPPAVALALMSACSDSPSKPAVDVCQGPRSDAYNDTSARFWPRFPTPLITNRPSMPLSFGFDQGKMDVMFCPEIKYSTPDRRTIGTGGCEPVISLTQDGEYNFTAIARTIRKNPQYPQCGELPTRPLVLNFSIIKDSIPPNASFHPLPQENGRVALIGNVLENASKNVHIIIVDEDGNSLANQDFPTNRPGRMDLRPAKTGDFQVKILTLDAAGNYDSDALPLRYEPFKGLEDSTLRAAVTDDGKGIIVTGNLYDYAHNLDPSSLTATAEQEMQFPRRVSCLPPEVDEASMDFNILCTKPNKRGQIEGVVTVTDVNGIPFEKKFKVEGIKDPNLLDNAGQVAGFAFVGASVLLAGEEFARWLRNKRRAEKYADYASLLLRLKDPPCLPGEIALPNETRRMGRNLTKGERKIRETAAHLLQINTVIADGEKDRSTRLQESLGFLKSAYSVNRLHAKIAAERQKARDRWLTLYTDEMISYWRKNKPVPDPLKQTLLAIKTDRYKVYRFLQQDLPRDIQDKLLWCFENI